MTIKGEKLRKLLEIITSLMVGMYSGYFYTNSHYVQKEAKNAKTEYTAICRLELREGNKGDVKNEYIALLEYRTEDGGKDFCEKYMSPIAYQMIPMARH